MPWHRWLAVACGLAILGCTGGCAAPPAPARLKVGVVLRANDTPFWETIRAGVEQAAAEDPRAEILWHPTDRANDALNQRRQVEEILTRGISGLILAPADPLALSPAIDLAIQRGIPCVAVENEVTLSPGSAASPLNLGYVGTDHAEAGLRAAQRFRELAGDATRYKIVVLRDLSQAEGIERNLAAFQAALKRSMAIEVVDRPLDLHGAAAWDAAAARLLKEHPDAAGAYGVGIAATQALAKARDASPPPAVEPMPTPKLHLVGFDADEALVAMLTAGQVQGLVLQDPFDMGYQATKRVLTHLKGEPRPAELAKVTQVQLATPENLDDPIVKVLLTRRPCGK